MPDTIPANVLLISDQPANLLALEVLLEPLRARLIRASLQDDTARLVAENSFAAALIDAPITALNTLRTVGRIQKAMDGRRTPVLYLTAADPSETDLLHAYSEGVADFVFKPVLPQVLRSKVQLFIDLHKAADAAKRAEHDLRILNQELAKRVTERTAELEAIQTRQKFLLDAGELLSSSLDLPTTLDRLVHSAVPVLADWCAVDQKAADGTIRRMAIAHPNPGMAALVQKIDERYPQDRNAEAGVPRVIRTGEPELVSNIPGSLLESIAKDNDHLEMLKQLRLHSYVCVPLIARGRILGAVTFASARDNLTYGPNDLWMAQELARRAAAAIDNARLYREARELFEEASDGIIIASPEGEYIDVNVSACRMLGYAREELIGKRIVEMIRPEDLPRRAEIKAVIEAGGVYRGQRDLRLKDGSFFPFELSVKILSDGRHQAIIREVGSPDPAS